MGAVADHTATGRNPVQQPLREPPSGLRQSPPDTVGASWTGWGWQAIGRGAAISLLMGVFLAMVGVTSAVSGGFLFRSAYMTTISMVAFLSAFGLWRLFSRNAFLERQLWLTALLVAVIQTPLMGCFVWGVDNLLGAVRPLSLLLGYVEVSFGISVFMNLLVRLMTQRRVIVVERDAAGPAPVRFLERLPAKLRGAQVWAIEAEDHYLRLHTSKGQDLILMRLADAVAELGGIEGAQVHRSWWVARDAIAGIARRDGRATLTLQDGAQVPVSRPFAKQLRERGWM